MIIKINGLEVDVKNIQTDSRKVKPGDMFIAYKGVSTDAHDYIDKAVENGASVVVGEKELDHKLSVPYFIVDDARAFWTDACAQEYDYPQNKLKIIGITGTDGKTTTCNFIYEILKTAGYAHSSDKSEDMRLASASKVGLISTVFAKFGDILMDTGLHTTTPDPDVLFKMMSEMLDKGMEYLVLEVTSHSLDLKKMHGINFICGGMTNVTPEHLDFHNNFEDYVKSKIQLFNQSEICFINGHSEISKIIDESYAGELIYTKYDDRVKDMLGKSFADKFPGDYNLENAALALAICEYLHVDRRDALRGLQGAPAPMGRFHKIENNLGINIIVDFAHTENAMRNVLMAVRKMMNLGEKLITVFGCAGERDTQKRPTMGKTSSELSDIVIITSEDPRSEDPDKIIEQVSAGNPDFDFIKIADRKDAIKKSLEIANKNDWILILGKGHEQSMNIKGVEYDWNDIKVVKKIIKESYV